MCKRYGNGHPEDVTDERFPSLKGIDEKIEAGELTRADVENLKELIQKLKHGEFFELLTMEFSGKIKEVARELIDFRKDIQTKIEPDIVEIASRDIPEASNQLEGINETLEESTMKIMDINEEQMELANSQLRVLEELISNRSGGKEISIGISLEDAIEAIERQMDVLKKIGDRSLRMMEPRWETSSSAGLMIFLRSSSSPFSL